MVPVKVAPLKMREKSKGPVVMGRRKEFNIQLNQIVDAVPCRFLLDGLGLRRANRARRTIVKCEPDLKASIGC